MRHRRADHPHPDVHGRRVHQRRRGHAPRAEVLRTIAGRVAVTVLKGCTSRAEDDVRRRVFAIAAAGGAGQGEVGRSAGDVPHDPRRFAGRRGHARRARRADEENSRHERGAMIRRATVSDAAALAELAARTFHDTFAAQNTTEDMEAYMSAVYGEAQQLSEIADPSRITLVVDEDSSLIAYAQLQLALPEIEIGRFYVDKAWHGRGIAQSLMNEVFAIARELDAKRVWLGVWEHNARAI